MFIIHVLVFNCKGRCKLGRQYCGACGALVLNPLHGSNPILAQGVGGGGEQPEFETALSLVMVRRGLGALKASLRCLVVLATLSLRTFSVHQFWRTGCLSLGKGLPEKRSKVLVLLAEHLPLYHPLMSLDCFLKEGGLCIELDENGECACGSPLVR